MQNIIENPSIDMSKMAALQAGNMEKSITIKTVPLKETLKENLIYLKELQQNGEAVLMLTYWHIGRVLHCMSEDSKYGDNIIIKACEVLGMGKTTLHAAKVFYCDFKEQSKIDTLSENGNVNWSLIKQVQRVGEPKQRAKLVATLMKKPVTVAKVSDMVDALNVGVVKAAKKQQNKQAKRYSPKAYFGTLRSKMERHKKAVDKISTDLSNTLADLEGVLQLLERADITDEDFTKYMELFHDASKAAETMAGSVSKLYDTQLIALMDKYTAFFEKNVNTE